MAKRVGTAEFEAEVLKEKLPVIVEFILTAASHVSSYHRFLAGSRMITRIRSRLSRSM